MCVVPFLVAVSFCLLAPIQLQFILRTQSCIQANEDPKTVPDESKDHYPGKDRRKGVVYEVPCKECDKCDIGETKRILKVRLGEHKQAVKRGDPKNGIAVHAHESNHTIDWDGAKVRSNASAGSEERLRPSSSRRVERP